MPQLPRDPETVARLVSELEQAKRALEEQLEAERESRASAEDANRRKDEFLAILSHDLRSPLNAVLTWIQVLRSPEVDDKARAQALVSLERIARLQTRMVEDLLDISRITSGKLSIELQEADFALILRSAVDTMMATAREKGVEVGMALDAKCVPMRGDPARLQQVIGNLLSNAVKFTPRGGRITVQLACPESFAELRITDTGEGIAPEVLPHVFDRFRQGGTSTTKRHGGLGLGLAIARHVVELHGGTIKAESEGDGRGATFRVRLPLERASAVADAALPAPSAGAIDLAGIRVLCVDDDPDTCLALEHVLQQAGCSVRTAGSVPEALRLVALEPPDVVITDLAMPDQDGYALLEALRSRECEGGPVPSVIVLTAAATPQDRQRVTTGGFTLHLTKPVEPNELLTAVRMTVSGLAKQFARQRAGASAVTSESRRGPSAA
jgi:CheY-like chemotaxis protein